MDSKTLLRDRIEKTARADRTGFVTAAHKVLSTQEGMDLLNAFSRNRYLQPPSLPTILSWRDFTLVKMAEYYPDSLYDKTKIPFKYLHLAPDDLQKLLWPYLHLYHRQRLLLPPPTKLEREKRGDMRKNIVKMREQGYRVSLIAEANRINRQTVYYHLRKHKELQP